MASSLTSHLFHLINEKWRTRQFTHIRYACPCSLVLSWHRWLQRCIYFLCAPKRKCNILTRCTWWSIGGKTYSIVSRRMGNVRIKSNQVPMMMMVWWRKSAFFCVCARALAAIEPTYERITYAVNVLFMLSRKLHMSRLGNGIFLYIQFRFIST